MARAHLQGYVTQKLGLSLNERLRRLIHSRIEYGIESDFAVSFEVSNVLGGFSPVTEDEFAAHPGERNIGIFGAGNPTEALRLLLEAYPDATVLVRRDGKRRRPLRKRKVSRHAR